MPSHLRPPEHRFARPIGVLAIAVGISLLVIAVFSSRPGPEDDLVQPVTATSETVLGEVVEQTTLPEAPPAEAVPFTTTTTESDDEPSPSGVRRPTRSDIPDSSPTTTVPPGTTTTTTRPATSTTSTTAPPTTTTQPTTTTTEPTTTTTEATTTTETTTTVAP